MTRPPDAAAAALLPAPLARRIAKALGAEIVHAEAVGGGYTPARRLRVGLSDGRTAFVKAATNENTLHWLRQEARVYAALEGAPFLAQRLAWEDHEQEPFLTLEDLSDAHWPRPGTPNGSILSSTLWKRFTPRWPASPSRCSRSNRTRTSQAGISSPNLRKPSSPSASAPRNGSLLPCPP